MSGPRVATALVLVALVVAGCSGGAAPSGSAPSSGGPAASGAAARDPRLPEFAAVDPDALPEGVAELEEAILARTIGAAGIADALGPDRLAWLEQLRRDAVAEAAAAIQLASAAGRVASIAAGPPLRAEAGVAGLGTSLSLVAILAGLDAATPGDSGTAQLPGIQEARESTEGGQRTSARVTVAVALRYEGSKVRATVQVSITATITDAASGAAVGTVTVDSTGTAEIDYCPDAGGDAAGRMDMVISGSSTVSGSPPPARSSVSSEIHGSVNDAASLTGYRVEGEAENSGGGPSGERSLRVHATAEIGLRTPGDIRSGEPGSAAGSVIRENPPATDAQVTELYREVGALGGFVAGIIATKAQDKWRGGACVRIDVGGEKSRTVAPEERVTITAKPVHVLERSDLDKPVVATLAGEGQLEPNSTPQDPPATIVFTAPDHDGGSGTVAIESTSNRGIGRASLVYSVGQAWDIAVEGGWTSSISGVEYRGTVKGRATHATLDAETSGSPGTGEGVHITASMRAAGCTLTFAPSDATLIVRVSGHGDAEVSLRFGVEGEGPPTAVGSCPAWSILLQAIGAGGLSASWTEILPEIVVARSGGTVSVSGSQTMGPFPITATAKVTVTPSK